MYICLNSDTDECSDGTHNCSQICINANGSYTCECDHGYALDFDEVTCNGMYKMCVCLYSIIIMITTIQTCMYIIPHNYVHLFVFRY